MKFVITGSLGHVGRPLTEELVKRGHDVTVVSSKADRRAEIESLGAKSAIGTFEDASFLTTTLRGADALFMLIATGQTSPDPNFDIDARFRAIGEACAQAIQAAGVTRLGYLSSIGAHLASGTGLLRVHHKMEAFLNQLSRVAVTFLRPTGFYTSLYNFIPMIKARGMIAAGYGDGLDPWVSPTDIATAAAEELEDLVTTGAKAGARKVRYVASEELKGAEVARILGEAIGKPELKWVIVPGEQIKQGMMANGMTPAIADAMVEMQANQRSGIISEDYQRNRPVLGRVKMTDFAKEFADAYHRSSITRSPSL